MKKTSLLLTLAVMISSALQATTIDAAKKVVKSTVKSNKLSKKSKMIAGLVGGISGLLLIVGGIYYRNRSGQQTKKFKRPLLDEDDFGVVFDEDGISKNFDPQKSRELSLLLKNGQKADDNTIIAAMKKLITDDDANPNGTNDNRSINAAIEGSRSLAIFQALLEYNPQVSENMIAQARQNKLGAGIIKLLESKLPELDIVPDDFVIVGNPIENRTSEAHGYSLLLEGQNSSENPLAVDDQ